MHKRFKIWSKVKGIIYLVSVYLSDDAHDADDADNADDADERGREGERERPGWNWIEEAGNKFRGVLY